MRQGKLLFVILSLVGVQNVLGQTWSASGTYSNLGSGSVNAGIGLTTSPTARLHVVGTSTLPAAYFTGGNVGIGIVPTLAQFQAQGTATVPSALFTIGKVAIGGLSTSFSSSLLPSELLHVRDGNMWLQRGKIRVSATLPTDDAILVSTGIARLTGGVYVGSQGPGAGSSMEYNFSQGYFELWSSGSPNNYEFKIGSLINGVDQVSPVLSTTTNMIFQTNSGASANAYNFKFMSGNSDLATLYSDGALKLNGDIKGYRTNSTFNIYSNFDYTNGAFIELTANGSTASNGDIRLIAGVGNGTTKKGDIVFARQNGASAGNVIDNMMIIKANGNVGIGMFPISTSNTDINDAVPIGLLDVAGPAVVRGDLVLKTNDPTRKIKINTNSTAQRAFVSGWNDDLIINFANDFEGGVIIQSGAKIQGRVDIGDKIYAPTDATVKLAVAGTVVAQKLKCTAASNWPDFVFDKSHTLQPLAEVEQYVQQHKHLPNIPSATELEASGIDTGEMLRLQMIKIEELTLHLIEQQKEMREIKKQLELYKK